MNSAAPLPKKAFFSYNIKDASIKIIEGNDSGLSSDTHRLLFALNNGSLESFDALKKTEDMDDRMILMHAFTILKLIHEYQDLAYCEFESDALAETPLLEYLGSVLYASFTIPQVMNAAIARGYCRRIDEVSGIKISDLEFRDSMTTDGNLEDICQTSLSFKKNYKSSVESSAYFVANRDIKANILTDTFKQMVSRAMLSIDSHQDPLLQQGHKKCYELTLGFLADTLRKRGYILYKDAPRFRTTENYQPKDSDTAFLLL